MPRHLIVLVCLGILVGCNSQDAADLRRDAGQLGKTAARSAGNVQLAARINAALAQRKGVDISGLHVEAKGGDVTLGGHVRNVKERATIVDTVQGIRGVDRVTNNLRIQP